MSKTKTAVIELYQGASCRGWDRTSSNLVSIHLTRKDERGKKWHYFNIPYYSKRLNGNKRVGHFKCKFQEQSHYVFTKCFSSGKWQGNVQVGMYPDVWAWVKILSLDFAEVTHA
jgi:hypothetical protein